MTELLWKATRPDGTTRHGVTWAVGETVTHPTSTAMIRDEPSTYLSLSAEPGETLIGGSWPCRLFRVSPVGDVIDSDRHPHKRCVLAADVVEKVPAWQALGPNGRIVAAIIERCPRLTGIEIALLGAARDAAWGAARRAAWDAARRAARGAARGAAGGALTADLISSEQYDLLTGPLVSVVGPLEDLLVPAWVDEVDPDSDTAGEAR